METEREPVVWIISSLQWPRAYLRAELIERGYDAVGYRGISDALEDLSFAYVIKPQVVVIDLHKLPVAGTELDRLAGCGIPMIALGGAVELGGETFGRHEWAAVLQRPFTLGASADLVEAVLASLSA